jgi:D-hexose-6-phosphate mutarotase
MEIYVKKNMDADTHTLNDRFGIPGRLTFIRGTGGLPLAQIENHYAKGRMFLQGAHVASYRPKGHQPVIWISEGSLYEKGKAIRGGIPVCWPWFADHPTDRNKPAHGFVRTALWSVRETGENKEGATRLTLGIGHDQETSTFWNHAFDLELSVTFGARLIITLNIRNPGNELFQCGGALHSYFAVGDSSQVQIQGLNGLTYIDKVDGFRRKIQEGPVRIRGETDQIFLETKGDCLIKDPVWQRRIRIAKKGSRTTVLWNPGAEKAAGMKDFRNEEYRGMVCVETANAADDVVTVAPGNEHILEAVIEALTYSS